MESVVCEETVGPVLACSTGADTKRRHRHDPQEKSLTIFCLPCFELKRRLMWSIAVHFNHIHNLSSRSSLVGSVVYMDTTLCCKRNFPGLNDFLHWLVWPCSWQGGGACWRDKKWSKNLSRESENATLSPASSGASRCPWTRHFSPNGSRGAEELQTRVYESAWNVKPR